MSKLHETAFNFAQQYSALTEFATALVAEGHDEEKAKNLKSEISLLEASLGQKKYQVDQITIAMSAHKVQLEQVQKDINRKFDEATEKANIIVKDGENKAVEIIDKARQRVASIKIEAAKEQDEASKRIADLQRQIADLEAYKKSLDASLLVLKQKFA